MPPIDAGIAPAGEADPGAHGVQPAQWRDWPTFARRARRHSATSGNADAEEGVRLAYRAAGLPPPQIVWCSGPVQLAHVWAGVVAAAGDNVRRSVVELPCRRGLRRIAELGRDKAGLVRTLFGGERNRVVSAAVQEAIIDEAGSARPKLLAWLNRPRPSGSARVGRRPSFAEAGSGPHDLCCAALAAHLVEALDGEADAGLRGMRMIAANAGWLVPHEGVCWLSPRPDVLGADPQGRLHCATGPALRYADGWALFAWKGTPLPAWMILRPQCITLRWIDAQIDPRIRHSMIDIITPERFIAAGGADRAASDASGTLWKRRWTHRGTIIDGWAALETAEARRRYWPVPADLETPREACAWLARPHACSVPSCLR